MSNQDKNIKDMWNQVENLMGATNYERERIQGFISSRSNTIADKVRKMLQLDIGLKCLFTAVLLLDSILYFEVQAMASYLCLAMIGLAIPLVLFEMKVLKQFNQTSEYGQSPKEKLAKMLTFLRGRFFTATLAISSSYIFLFISGMLMYFFLSYGEVRRLDNMDIFVFSTFIIIGIVMNFAINYGQINYYIKHIETCLSDLNDNALAVVSSNIEIQQKQDKTTKMLLGLVLIFGFVVLIAILKKLGF